MTSIRASIASMATELRPTASSEKSRVRARFPLGLFLACLFVFLCACCQDFPPPPSPPRLDSPSLKPSLAAVQLRELLQAGSFAFRSEVRCTRHCSVAVPRHHGLKKLCVHLLRSVRCRPRRPLNLALCLSVLSRWCPWLLLRPLGLSARGRLLLHLLLHPRPPLGFLRFRLLALVVGQMVAPTLLIAREVLTRFVLALHHPPLHCRSRCPLRFSRSRRLRCRRLCRPLLSLEAPCRHTFCLLWRVCPSLRLPARTRALFCNRSLLRLCTFRPWPPLLLKPVWRCPLLVAFIQPWWLCLRAGWLFCVRLPRPPHCSLTVRLPPIPKLT